MSAATFLAHFYPSRIAGRDAHRLEDCLEIVKSLFFPSGESPAGNAKDMSSALGNYAGECERRPSERSTRHCIATKVEERL